MDVLDPKSWNSSKTSDGYKAYSLLEEDIFIEIVEVKGSSHLNVGSLVTAMFSGEDPPEPESNWCWSLFRCRSEQAAAKMGVKKVDSLNRGKDYYLLSSGLSGSRGEAVREIAEVLPWLTKSGNPFENKISTEY